MINSMSLPCLPWFNFDRKIGHERYHRIRQWDIMHGKITYLIDQKVIPQNLDKQPFPWDPPPGPYPKLYPQKDIPELPAWIVYDKHVLCFDAFFCEKGKKVGDAPKTRFVKIVFFLEDGTVQINEKSQGTFLRRHRIPYPSNMGKAFFEEADFNIGKIVEIYGRHFHIYNCDKFTRQWLNKSGIAVPDPMDPPQLPPEEGILDLQNRSSATKPAVKPRDDKLRQFLDYDKHVLSFKGYWDDRASEGGHLHKVVLHYYLVDDTIEIKEYADGAAFSLSRCRLPKHPDILPQPGDNETVTLLNVLETGAAVDVLNMGYRPDDYYKDCDLAIGTCLNVYGRAVFLVSCDAYTREFYNAKYGLDTYGEVLPYPEDTEEGIILPPRELPKFNGFGTHEDSARNCVRIVPKRDDSSGVAKKLEHTGNGLESRVLKYVARMLPVNRYTTGKQYIVCFYLADDTVSIFQEAFVNSGYLTGMVFRRREAWKGTPNMFVPRKPCTYSKEDFWVGNVLEIDFQSYELLEANEYTLRYMELNNQEFPKSNVNIILPKIRERMKPIYKDFACKYLLLNEAGIITIDELFEALQALLGNEISKQEIITVARSFAVCYPQDYFPKKPLKDVCRNECRRLLFVGFERLSENLHYQDPCKTGYVSEKTAYNTIRGARVPVDPALLKFVFSKVDRNETGEISITDLLSFFDPAGLPTDTYIPFCHVAKFSQFSLMSGMPDYSFVNAMKLLDHLGLEYDLRKKE